MDTKIMVAGGRIFKVESDVLVTAEVEEQIKKQIGIGCASCGQTGMTSLAAVTCPTNVSMGSTKTLVPTTTGGVAPYAYSLQLTQPNGSVTITPFTTSTVILFSSVGNYTLSLTSTDANGCISDAATCTVNVVPACPTLAMAIQWT